MFRSRPAERQPAKSTVDDLSRSITGYGFGSQLELPSLPVPDSVFRDLLAGARHHRLIGAIAELSYSGALPITEDQRQLLAAHHLDWARQALQVERIMVTVGECFTRSSIDFRVLKGPALCRLVYADPAWRVFSDLDILVPSGEFDHAVRIVRQELGGEQWMPELRPGFDREFGKEAVVAVDGIEVDMHRTFVAGPFGLTIDLDELFKSQLQFDAGGGSFAALEPTSMILHAAYNLAIGDYPMRLCAVRDLLAAQSRLEVHPNEVIAVARAWRATAVLQRAARLAIDTVDLAPGNWLEDMAALPVPRIESLMLRSYLTSSRGYTRELASLMVVRGVRPRLRFVQALAAPSANYLESRGWNERNHIRRARDVFFGRE